MPSKNRILVSAAGSGKTTEIVRAAIAAENRKCAIVTYTNQNYDEIRDAIWREAGRFPAHIEVFTWFTFLLRELIRPYQVEMYDSHRIESIEFVSGQTQNMAKKEDVAAYYLRGDRLIYSDRASDFALKCDDKSGGLVLNRLAMLFDQIYVDEVQDFAGWELDVLEAIARSPKIALTLVGDVRQATYATSRSNRNKQYAGIGIMALFGRWKEEGLFDVEQRAESHRCHQDICDLADSLYPQMPTTKSTNTTATGHDGVFLVAPGNVPQYTAQFGPAILRWNRTEECLGLPHPINYGECKGRTYARTLIFPNGTLRKFLKTGDTSALSDPPSKYYVAITRARHSVAFVHEGVCALAKYAKFQP
jgi:DNA helicase II / ATP-dependent DNA helicase PcrA